MWLSYFSVWLGGNNGSRYIIVKQLMIYTEKVYYIEKIIVMHKFPRTKVFMIMVFYMIDNVVG